MLSWRFWAVARDARIVEELAEGGGIAHHVQTICIKTLGCSVETDSMHDEKSGQNLFPCQESFCQNGVSKRPRSAEDWGSEPWRSARRTEEARSKTLTH